DTIMDEIFSKDLVADPEDLVEDFKSLYESKEDYDTIITVGKEQNAVQIYAHSQILCARSSYFHRALSDEWVVEKDGYFVLSNPNTNALIFNVIIKFLYCGIIDLKGQNDETILELLVTADELVIQGLIDIVQNFLVQNSYTFLQKSPIRMLHFITTHENRFNELKEAYLETICKHPHLLFDSDEFLSLEKDTLKLILECDNLDLKESIIWKKLVEWGIAQHERNMMCDDNKNDDMICDDTNNEDTNNEDTKELHELTKLIRFYQMDPKEFVPEVWEYMDILPKGLIKDVVRCYLDSDVKPSYQPFLIRWGNFNITSAFINKEVALLLMKWISRKATDDKTLKGFKYKFNLLFRSNLDGSSSRVFHRKCDKKGATIVVGRISNSNRLVGGYNPLDWSGDNIWKKTANSFLFTLDKNNLNNATISRVNPNNSGCAIGCNVIHGPSFGEGPDLHVSNNSVNWEFKPKSYPKLVSSDSLTVSEYEVFQVVKAFK
ncbi:32066_t:CDS:2, partial [Racocetra persica]